MKTRMFFGAALAASIALAAPPAATAVGIGTRENVKVETGTGAIVRPEISAFVRTNEIATTSRANTFTAAQTFGSAGSAVGSVVFGTATITNGQAIVSNASFRATSVALADWANGGGTNPLLCAVSSNALVITPVSSNVAAASARFIAITP